MFDYSRKPVKWQVGNFSNIIYSIIIYFYSIVSFSVFSSSHVCIGLM